MIKAFGTYQPDPELANEIRNSNRILRILVFLIAVGFLLLSCGTRQHINQLPTFAFHQTDSGMVWVYRNHERAEIIGPFLITSAPGTLDSAKVEYFPNGVQPPSVKEQWRSWTVYTGRSF